ncbi:MAG: CTP synthase [Candidatus Yanofskybacteria bacterium]|nr:CTP synthase [Candidatus Yanofskybacteria bacterium]
MVAGNGQLAPKAKFIFVVGGVMSGIGKGVTVASTARILKDYGFKVTAVKIDPYLNVDAGTMNPTEHGEVFVTNDGDETDQDIGNYERFLNENIPRENYMTAGRVYQAVLNRERALGYGGKCVQIIPHVTDEIKERILKAAEQAQADFVLVEIGGTVGEYENQLFLETGRIMKLELPGQVLFMLVSYFPVPAMVGEMKTKPTQHAVRMLNYAGIQADFIIARSSMPIDEVRKKKVSLFCNMDVRDVISAPDVRSIYEVPINFEKDNLGTRILEKIQVQARTKDGKEWSSFVQRIHDAKKSVKIGIVGKYFETGDFILSDSYLSVIEAVKHASWALGRKPEITWLNAEAYEQSPETLEELWEFDGIIVPGGFGARGIEGKINVIRFLRENNIPFLGLCYGLQLATIEFARNVCGLKGAHTTEINPETLHPIIHTMADQVDKIKKADLGGTMRLGAYDCKLHADSKSRQLYGTHLISERHRHRYEVNNNYLGNLRRKGMLVAGVNPQNNLVEIIELPTHKFFVGTQFHPELKSRPLDPHPLFRGFVQAAIK